MSQNHIVEIIPDSAINQTPIVPKYAWVILFAVFVAGVAAPLNLAKVPPLLPVLMKAFELTLSQAGMLMSVFAITGLILSLPAGLILRNVGPKLTGLVAVGSLGIGASLGALSTNTLMLSISRIIEGIGMGLIAVVAPAVIAMWFPREKQGTPMGIWAIWVPVGSLTMLILAPRLGIAVGWQAVWWVGAGYALLAFILYWILIRQPPILRPDIGPEVNLPDDTPLTLLQALANRNIWVLALEFACFNLLFMSLGSFFPTYLSTVRGYSLPMASLVWSLITITVLVSAPASGWLSDRIGSRRLLLSLPYLALALLMLFPFEITGWQLYVYMILLGGITGAIPTATFAAVPEVMVKPELAGLGMAALMVGQNLGMIIGPILFGSLVESLGWTAAGYWLIPVCLLGFISGWLVKVR